jgi:O-antigen ligase
VSGRAVALHVLVLLVGAAAFAFGSVETWADEGLRALALLVFLLTFWQRPRDAVASRAVRALALPGALLLFWAALQLVPMPRAALAAVAPQTAALYAQAVPEPWGGEHLPAWLLARAPEAGARPEPGARAWKGPADEGDRSVGRTVSVHPHATRAALLEWGTMLLLFLSAASLARDASRRYRLLWGIAAWTGLLGLTAVFQSVAWNQRILWLRTAPEDAIPLGPFVNHNHFAAYVEMGTLAAVGLLLAILARSEGRLSASGIRAALGDREWALPRALAVGLLVVLGVGGLVLAGSRGGVLAFGVGVLVLALVGARRTRAWLSFMGLALALLGLGAGLAAWVAPDPSGLQGSTFVSTESDPSATHRLDAYAKTLRILVDNPVTGTGLGTFPWAYARYERRGEWIGMAQAHNDYLQLAAETGIPGVLLLAWALIAFGWRVLRPALGSGKHVPRWTTAATAAAVLAMLFHSVLDFSLQVPAVAALFSVLLGVLAAAAEDRSEQAA